MSFSTKSSAFSTKKSIASERSEQCCDQNLAADCKASVPSLKASIYGTTSSKDLDVVKKLMEWWYLAPLLFAVLMFLLVGTVFEKRIETAVRGFGKWIDRYVTILFLLLQHRNKHKCKTIGTCLCCSSLKGPLVSM